MNRRWFDPIKRPLWIIKFGVAVIASYPFIELTRLIIWYGETYSFIPDFTVEIGFIIFGWIAMQMFIWRR